MAQTRRSHPRTEPPVPAPATRPLKPRKSPIEVLNRNPKSHSGFHILNRRSRLDSTRNCATFRRLQGIAVNRVLGSRPLRWTTGRLRPALWARQLTGSGCQRGGEGPSRPMTHESIRSSRRGFRKATQDNSTSRKLSARRGSPFVQQWRVYPARSDGYRLNPLRWGGRPVQPVFCSMDLFKPRRLRRIKYYRLPLSTYGPRHRTQVLPQYRHHGPH